MNKLKVGIAGYGVVGKRRHKFIDENPSLKTVAVSDISFKTEGKLNTGVKFYNDYKHLLNEDLDIIFICLPNYLAAEATILGLEKGLHVFCEKPPGRNLEDIKNVRDVEKKFPKQKLKYGFNHRYHESYLYANDQIKNNTLGKVLSIRGVYGKSRIIPFDGGWRSERKYAGGGILLDQGIHMLDMIVNLCGDFEEVHSFVSNDFWNHDVEDNAFAILRSKSGIIAMIHSTATQWQHKFSLEITLEKGLIELSGILSGSKSYGQEVLRMIYRDENSNNGSFDEVKRTFLEDNSWKLEIDEFASIILGNEKVVNGSSLDALRVMEIIDRVYKSDPKWKNKFYSHTKLENHSG